jgi:dTDP-4-dehydrorhamnose 3,5-epimerase-like enzyme
MSVTIESLPVARDPRGAVYEPVGIDHLPAQHNVHVVYSVPGAVRGNHYHPKGTEILVVQGPALVRYREDSRVMDRLVKPEEVLRFVFPPGIAHAIQNTGPAIQYLVSFNTEPHDRARPDVVRDVLIPASPEA